MTNDEKATQLANAIRSLARDIDSKVEALRTLGYDNAQVVCNSWGKLELTAAKTTTVSL